MLARDMIGALVTLLVLVAVGVSARAARKRSMPELTGPVAGLAEIILGVSIVVLTGELLGTFGLFAFVPLLFAFCAIAVVALRLGGARSFGGGGGESADDEPPVPRIVRSPRLTRWWNRAAIVAVAVVTAEWMSRVVDSWHRGMPTVDTLWYHLPVAARFAQDGWTSRLVFVEPRSLIVFYPSTSELLHAIGIVFLGNDTLSLVLNMGFVALAFLAAWCIGRPFGVAPVTLTGVAVVLATPQLVLDDAGSALNDIVSLAFFLAAVALVVDANHRVPSPNRRAEMLCGALAAGLAAGTKYTMVVPIVLLAIAVIALTPDGRRVRMGSQWLAAALVAGGYWYLRNLVRAGNPVPTARLGFGPWHLPSIPISGSTIAAQFVFDADAWRLYFLPGLHGAFGPMWWSIVVAAVAGMVVGAASSNTTARVLGLLGFGCLVVYAFTPQILGTAHAPFLFKPNARYVAPAFTLGVLALPVALSRRSSRLLSLLLFGLLVVLAGTQFATILWRNEPSGYESVSEGWMPTVFGLASGVVLLAGGAAIAGKRPRLRLSEHRGIHLAAGAGMVGVLLLGAVAGEQYALRHRYRKMAPMPTIYRWAQGVHDARIAIVGFLLQYPLTGNDVSNHVQYLAVHYGHAESAPIADCPSWRRAVNDGRYQYVVASTPGFPFLSTAPAREAAWTRSDPASHLVVNESTAKGSVWVYEIRGRLNPSGCANSP